MPDTITRTIVIGAARILVNEATAYRPQRAEDVVSFDTYEAINNWVDIGVTKTGVREVNDDIQIAMAEVNLDKLNLIAASGPFQIVALWNDSEADEDMHISLRTYESVQIKSIEVPEVMHEGKSIPIVFARYP